LNRDVVKRSTRILKASFKTKIRDNIALAEAPAQGMNL
jgi:hypothetical protein